MANNYREFSSTVTRNFHYRFTCEHCGGNTGWIKGTVYGTGRYASSLAATSLTAPQTSELNKQAAEKLENGYAKVKRLANSGSYHEIPNVAMEYDEKGSAYRDYSGRNVGFPIKCPSCGKEQSWQTGGYWGFIAVPPVVLTFVVSFLWFILTGQLASHSIGQLFEVVPTGIWVLGAGIGLIAGILWYVLAKKKATNGKVRNKPEFMWD